MAIQLLILLAGVMSLVGCATDGTSPQPSQGSDAGVLEAGDGPAPQAGISLLSWNLRTFPLSDQTHTFVVDTVMDLNVHLLAVQEISDTAAFTALASALPHHDGVINDDPGAYQRLGLIYDSERVVVTEVETLFVGDWFPFPRPPLKAHVTATSATGGTFDFILVVVHLKAYLDAESVMRRIAACEALDEWTRAQLTGGFEQDIVIIGDFNDNLTDLPQNNVFQPFLQAPEIYTFMTLPLEEAGQHTYIPFESFIDHVLITTDALAEYGDGKTTVLPLEATSSAYQVQVSDHRPVLSLFAVD